MDRLGARAERSFRAAPDIPGNSIDADVTHELDRLGAAGFPRAILVDLTRPDTGVPAVRMVVPGLEGWIEKGEPNVPGARRLAVRAGA